MNPNQNTNMTELMYSMATSGSLTLPQAVAQLKENAHLRSVRETLAKLCGLAIEDKAGLQARLAGMLMACEPGAKRDSVDRKVRGWLKDGVQTIARKSALQLAFALGLNVDEANFMLIRLCEEGFHARDPEEIAYICALQQGLDYPAACAMMERLREKGLLERPRHDDPNAFTGQLRGRLSQITTEAELEDFLRDNHARLGALHNTAYSLFIDFLDLLGLPRMNDGLPDVKAMPIREVIATYLHNNFIPRVRRATKNDPAPEKLVMSSLQRDIRQNWPDEAVLSRMIHRETDVTRKVLILLFLATDGGDSMYGDLSDEDSEDIFQDMYERISSMLADCGFAPLDSRVPFDWMVLYCMCAGESIYIDGRIQRFLAEVFPSTGSEAGLAASDAVPRM